MFRCFRFRKKTKKNLQRSHNVSAMLHRNISKYNSQCITSSIYLFSTYTIEIRMYCHYIFTNTHTLPCNVPITLAERYTVTFIYNLLKAPASVFMHVPTNPVGMKSFYHFKSTNTYNLHLTFP
jgi:hypothetical protein